MKTFQLLFISIMLFAFSSASAKNYNTPSFEGKVFNNQQIQLIWTVTPFIGEQGLEIERQDASGIWHNIGFVKNGENTNAVNNYFFTDPAPANGLNIYRLKILGAEGKFNYSDIVTVEFRKGITGLQFQNYPNPFIGTTSIKYQVATRGQVRILIYDIMGKQLSLLVNKPDEMPGSYNVQWNGSNYPAGTYIYKIVTADGTVTQKMIMAKQ